MADHHSAIQSLNGAATGSGSTYSINLDNFSKRLKALYLHWSQNKDTLWDSSDIFCIATPQTSEYFCHPKSSALSIWLLGYEFPQMIMIFMKTEIHFLSSQNVASQLGVVKKSAKAVRVDIVLHVREDTDDGTRLIEAIFKSTGAQYSRSENDAPFFGYIGGEVPKLELLEPWAGKIRSACFRHSYINNGLLALFNVKDEEELMNVKKAACLSYNIMEKVVVPKIKSAAEKKEITRATLMDDIVKALDDTVKAILDTSLFKASLKPKDVTIFDHVISHSGGVIDLRASAASTEDNLDCGNKNDTGNVITCALGARYRSYFSFIARSFLVDSYASLFPAKVYEILLKARDATISTLRPGNIIGDAYKAAVSVVRGCNPGLIPFITKSAGTGLGLEFAKLGLKITAGNTCVVKAGMVFLVCLGFSNLQCYTDDSNKHKRFSLLVADTIIVGELNTEVVTQLFDKDEEKWMSERWIAELPDKEMDKCPLNPVPLPSSTEALREFLNIHNIRCAPKIEQYLNHCKRLIEAADVCHLHKIFLVRRRDDLEGLSHLREHFGCPGIARLEHCLPEKIKTELIEFAKIRKVPVETSEADTRHRHEQLKEDVDPVRLTKLWIAPLFGDKREIPGTLEAHVNGFRYSTTRAECVVDIMYKNIKHAFFLTAETEGIILLHFHLDKPILVGNKKTKDVQFFVEMIGSDQTGGGKTSEYKTIFQSFLDKLREPPSNLEFDLPRKEFGFNGVPNKQKRSAFIVPTSRCLVQLIQTPFLVVPLSDIEDVKLECVSGETFNMIIVIKGAKKLRIKSILSTSLDVIKMWLRTTGILDSEWQQMLQTNSSDVDEETDSEGEGTNSSDVDEETGSEGEGWSEMEEEEVKEEDYAFLARIKKAASNRQRVSTSNRALVQYSYLLFRKLPQLGCELQNQFRYVYTSVVYRMVKRYMETGIEVLTMRDIEALTILKYHYLADFKCKEELSVSATALNRLKYRYVYLTYFKCKKELGVSATASNRLLGQILGARNLADKIKKPLTMNNKESSIRIIETAESMLEQFLTKEKIFEDCCFCSKNVADADTDERVVQLPCSHSYHLICFARWGVPKKFECPFCRKNCTAEAVRGRV